MRIVFFGQSGPYSPWALKRLLDSELPCEIVAIVEGRRRPMGRHNHRWLKPKRAGRQPRLPVGESLSELAVAAGIPVFQTCDVNARRVVDELDKLQLDLMVCAGFDRLFTGKLLRVPRLGGLNAHPSALPELRGPAPIFWALRQGCKSLTLTLHMLDEREDHGSIVAQREFAIPPRATGDSVYQTAGEVAGRLLVEVIPRALAGDLVGLPQNHSRATRAPRPRPEDLYIEPAEWTCEGLVDFACGAPYFKAPWLKLGDDTFFVRRGLKASPAKRLPAQYLLQGSELIVCCSDGLAHLEIQV